MIKGWFADVEGERLAEVARDTEGIVVELGTAWGLSTSYVLSNAHSNIVCVDKWEDEEIYQEFLSLIKANGWEKRVHVIRDTTKNAAVGWTEPIGVLFIDASHEYEDVRSDYLEWSPHVVSGGWLCFHDAQWEGVNRVLREDVFPSKQWVNATITNSLLTTQRRTG